MTEGECTALPSREDGREGLRERDVDDVARRSSRDPPIGAKLAVSGECRGEEKVT